MGRSAETLLLNRCSCGQLWRITLGVHHGDLLTCFVTTSRPYTRTQGTHVRIGVLICIWFFYDLQIFSQRGAFRHPGQDQNYARGEAAFPATLRSTTDSSPSLRACALQHKRQQVSLYATLTYLTSYDVAHNQRSRNRPYRCLHLKLGTAMH